MSTAHFRITYDGPALADHQMDVKKLSPALHAVGELLEAANRVLNEDHGKVSVRVQGSFKTGSFGIDFALMHSPWEILRGLLVHDNTQAALNLVALLGLAGGTAKGLLQLIKWLRGRNPTRIIDLDDGRVRIEVLNEAIEVELEVLKLLQDYKVRKAVEAMITEPMSEGSGVENFASGPVEGDGFFVVEAREARAFVAPPATDTDIGETRSNKWLQLAGVSFVEGNKWRFSDGSTTFPVAIEDEEFVQMVQKNEIRFGAGDLLSVDLVSRQFLNNAGKMSTEHVAKRVLEHRKAAVQVNMVLPRGENED
ncbi:MAG: hypothetical protein P1P84_06635 [Deferrisomatales bacterium]|nr:hypothetical protein [Deferrisomatales bacterium]